MAERLKKIRPLLIVQLTLLFRTRSFFAVVLALAAWALGEHFLGGAEPSFALNVFPLVAMWCAAVGLHEDRSHGGVDLIVNRGATLGELLVSRFAVVAFGSCLVEVLLLLPWLVRGQFLNFTVELVALTVFAVAVASSFGFWIHQSGVVLIALASTTVSLVWTYQLAPLWMRVPAGDWPAGPLTWILQLGGDYMFPACQLRLLEGRFEFVSGLHLLLAGFVLVVSVGRLNRVSMPGGQ